MTVFRLTKELVFPDPSLAEPDGLLAVGGDLHPERLLIAYALGIFPWFTRETPPLWWSPAPRLVLFPDEFKVSKSLKKTVRQGKFEIRFDTRFRDTITRCADVVREDDEEGPGWITHEMVDAYTKLHELGFAHSVEAYVDDKLVGGLYGIAIGSVFFGESMFHEVKDASKVAFYHLVEFLRQQHFTLIDCQVRTDHLLSLGAEEISKEAFTNHLQNNNIEETLKGLWTGLG